MIELENKKVLVVGLGDSGFAAAKAARGLRAAVTVIDSSGEPARAESIGELESLGVTVNLGVSVPTDISIYDLLVASPGVPGAAPPLKAAKGSGVEVISELELGYRMLDNDFVAVTGTNGKTTTTELAAMMLSGEGRRAIPCGNIGDPVAGLAGEVSPGDIMVAEVSSFQLANIEKFRPRVAVILNIAPDHYDWHADFDEYFAAKARIVENQGPDDFVVFNEDDGHCRAIALTATSRPAGFGGAPGSGTWIEGDRIMAGQPLLEEPLELVPVSAVRLVGGHNLHNIMAAAGAALAMGATPERVGEVASSFEGLEHRMEPVTEIDGVTFYDDSKATNPHASLHALSSFEGPMVLISGGRNKGLEFDVLARAISERVAAGSLAGVVLVGESAPEMESAIANESAGARSLTVTCAGLEDAVAKAFSICPRPGVVLFSPACASFDMFDDYKHRGRAFKEAVRGLSR